MTMAAVLTEQAKTFGTLFYISSPNQTSFETIEEVPNYVVQAAHHFYILIALEFIVLYLQGESRQWKLNDSITSVSGGLLMEMFRLVSKGVEFKAYLYIYENFCLYNLPWDSPVTWILAALGTDLGYYWVHRSCHEVNIMWAAHQMHHSSEYYNLTTALRQSIFQFVFAWPFYLPMALFIPPTQFLVHTQINLIYQFWIHAGAVKKLPGPIEFIFNTPSHHRVHHGANRYCIDKNYAGWLIIWDRMFGTFEPEGDEIVYGLTHPVNSFNPIWAQIHHLVYMWGAFKNADGIGNKIRTICYGPGWGPGKPRLGLQEDLPDHKAPMPRYNPRLPLWFSFYLLLHFVILIPVYFSVCAIHDPLSLDALTLMAFMVTSLSSFGAIMDKTSWGIKFEAFRCLASFIVLRFLHVWPVLQGVFFSSCILWGYYFIIPRISAIKKAN